MSDALFAPRQPIVNVLMSLIVCSLIVYTPSLFPMWTSFNAWAEMFVAFGVLKA